MIQNGKMCKVPTGHHLRPVVRFAELPLTDLSPLSPGPYSMSPSVVFLNLTESMFTWMTHPSTIT